jgi:hypothetical protein
MSVAIYPQPRRQPRRQVMDELLIQSLHVCATTYHIQRVVMAYRSHTSHDDQPDHYIVRCTKHTIQERSSCVETKAVQDLRCKIKS